MASYADFDRLLEAVQRANAAEADQLAIMAQMARETRAAIAAIPEQPAAMARRVADLKGSQ